MKLILLPRALYFYFKGILQHLENYLCFLLGVILKYQNHCHAKIYIYYLKLISLVWHTDSEKELAWPCLALKKIIIFPLAPLKLTD